MPTRDHPYGTLQRRHGETVSALAANTCIAATAAALTRDRVVVGAAGDITPEELGLLIDTRILGDLARRTAPSARPKTCSPSTSEGQGVTVVISPSPHRLRSSVRKAFERRLNPDFLRRFTC